MTKKILLIAILTFSSIQFASARAKIPVCFPCETMHSVQELPAGSELEELAGEKVNISYINDEYGILWLSAWNSNGRFVLSDVGEDSFYELDEQAAQILKEKHNFDIATAGNPLSFMKKIGGKLILGVVVILIIWGMLPSKKDKEEIEPTNV